MTARSAPAAQFIVMQPLHWLHGAALRLVALQRRYAERLRLADLDDAALKDIGLSRYDVRAELNRPFWRF